jgi:type VI secretion system protein ImpE
MKAKELFQAGKLTEAIQALGAELRDNPTDVQRRTFLFELLCFNGEFDRAEKHLKLLADSNQQAYLGSVVFHAALHAERARHELFGKKEFPSASAKESGAGSVNGRSFNTVEDSDPRLGARLEIYAAGSYLWIPFEHLHSLETEPPKKLRDLLWMPAVLSTTPAFKMTELGEVLIPVISPFSYQHPDEQVRLGRMTVWEKDAEGEPYPQGLKMLLVDGEEEIPFLEIRKLEFPRAEADDQEAATA